MFASEGNGPDDRPLLEVSTVEVGDGQLLLAGTACVYEGNVLICLISKDEVRHAFTQATAGGPERGSWSHAEFLPPLPLIIEVGGEDATAGDISEATRVRLSVDSSRRVGLVAS